MLSDKIKNLSALCKCSITININEHNGNNFEDIILKYNNIDSDILESIPKEIFSKMIEMDSFVEIIFDSDQFPEIYHYDLDLAIDQAIGLIKCLLQNN